MLDWGYILFMSFLVFTVFLRFYYFSGYRNKENGIFLSILYSISLFAIVQFFIYFKNNFFKN